MSLHHMRARGHKAQGIRTVTHMTAEHMAIAIVPATPTQPTQPGLVPFRVWRERYAYFVDCVLENVRTAIDGPSTAAAVQFDWPGVRCDLEKYLYATGHSRFRSFYLLSGPRPARHPAWSSPCGNL